MAGPDLSHPDFPALCGHLNRRGVDYLVIGGWAAIAHGLPRTTLDVDLYVRPERENLDRLVGALSGIGFGVARELDADELLRHKVFLFADQIRVDLFLEPWGLDGFEACWERRREVELDSVRIPFVGIDDLIRSKETDREQDRLDREALRQIRDAAHPASDPPA